MTTAFSEYDQAARWYGFRVAPSGWIVAPTGKATGLKLEEKGRGRRLRIMHAEGQAAGRVLFSGPRSAGALTDFLKHYWFARRLAEPIPATVLQQGFPPSKAPARRRREQLDLGLDL